MKARYRHLLDHSIACSLAAIEVYNKPLFKEREQVFAILLITAWEALLKARILRNNRNRLSALYVRIGRRYKKSRTGRYLTVDLVNAARLCDLNDVALQNLERLLDVRDAAIHLTADSPSLPYLTYTLGLAALRNYARLVRDWFSVSLDEYDLFILPVGFKYPFRTVSPAALKKEPAEIAAILREVTRSQQESRDESDGFHLAFEITTTLVSAKKLAGEADVTAAVDPLAKGAVVVERRVRVVDQYPYSFKELWDRVKAIAPFVGQTMLLHVLREAKMRGDPKYSAYNWRNKAQEKRGPRPEVPVIYNEDAVRFIAEECRRRIVAAD